MTAIAIVPARGGSKRIKNKNVMDFFGRPMIAYSLDAARGAEVFDEIHVSTESEEIRRVVTSLGFPPAFLRDPALADDQTGLIPVLHWVLDRYADAGRRFDDVCLLMAAAPLVEASDLRGAFEHYERSGRRPLLAVSRYPAPVEWAFDRDASGLLTARAPAAMTIRSQDLREAYYDTGTFAMMPTEHVMAERDPGATTWNSYVLTRAKAVDIDDQDDLLLAQALYLGSRRAADSSAVSS